MIEKISVSQKGIVIIDYEYVEIHSLDISVKKDIYFQPPLCRNNHINEPLLAV